MKMVQMKLIRALVNEKFIPDIKEWIRDHEELLILLGNFMQQEMIRAEIKLKGKDLIQMIAKVIQKDWKEFYPMEVIDVVSDEFTDIVLELINKEDRIDD